MAGDREYRTPARKSGSKAGGGLCNRDAHPCLLGNASPRDLRRNTPKPYRIMPPKRFVPIRASKSGPIGLWTIVGPRWSKLAHVRPSLAKLAELGPKLANLWPSMAKLGLLCPSLAQSGPHCSKSGQTWSNSNPSRQDVGQMLANNWPNLTEHWSNLALIRKHWPKFGPTSSTFGQCRRKSSHATCLRHVSSISLRKSPWGGLVPDTFLPYGCLFWGIFRWETETATSLHSAPGVARSQGDTGARMCCGGRPCPARSSRSTGRVWITFRCFGSDVG